MLPVDVTHIGHEERVIVAYLAGVGIDCVDALTNCVFDEVLGIFVPVSIVDAWARLSRCIYTKIAIVVLDVCCTRL